MKNLKRVSRWITISTNYNVTPKNSLYDFACDGYGNGTQSSDFDPSDGVYLDFFRWNGRTYALNQFLSRFGICGFDEDCKEYPAFITGYDGNDYYNPILCELSPWGDKIRLYKEV